MAAIGSGFVGRVADCATFEEANRQAEDVIYQSRHDIIRLEGPAEFGETIYAPPGSISAVFVTDMQKNPVSD